VPGERLVQPTIRPDDLCFLQFTSGSTSLPKGVMVSHANLVANARAFLGPTGVNASLDDLTVTWLPLYHDMGLIGFVLGALVCHLPSVLMPTEAFGRRPNIWLETLHQTKGTLTFAPNFAYALATKRARDKDLEGLDLSRVRLAGCGAEPINPKVMHEFAERFARCGFRREALLPAYGMAEATLAITFHPRETPFQVDRASTAGLRAGVATPAADGDDATELVSCGVAFPEHEIKIVDEQGKPLDERHVGEIWTRGPSITQGYFGNPEATAESFTDGWLHTGDLGYIAAGNLYVCGRLKDLIIIRGANFYPQDLEWAVAELDGVRRDNVVAFSVVRSGEETLVICAEANSGDAPALRKAITSKVAETAGITVGHVAIVKVGSLPKTSSGKVQRRRTKSLFETDALEEHPA
jgi:fatty-acyl-CoA synthase